MDTNKKLAEQFDELSALMSAIAGTFRDAGGTGASDGDDEPAEKPVRARKSRGAAKPAAKSEAEDEVTEDTVRQALKDLSDVKGKGAVAVALKSVGAGRLPDVDESQYGELMDKIKELTEAEDEPPAKPAKAAAKGKAKKPAAPSFEDLQEKFKELVDQDRAAAKAVLKDAGLAKLGEVDQDSDDDMTALMTAIEAALESEEDDDLVG